MKVEQYQVLWNVPNSDFEPYELDGYYFPDYECSFAIDYDSGIFTYHHGQIVEINKDSKKAWSCIRGNEAEAFIEFMATVIAFERLGRVGEMPVDGEYFSLETYGR